MITITNDFGATCQKETLDEAVEFARDYLISRMADCDLTCRVVLTTAGKFIASMTWENVF